MLKIEGDISSEKTGLEEWAQPPLQSSWEKEKKYSLPITELYFLERG